MKPSVSRPKIAELISRGRAIVLYDGEVLDLTGWLPKHPGGDKAVQHMIGRDATDEMNAYHCDETQQTFTRFSIGRSSQWPWENMIPPIQGAEGNGSMGIVPKVAAGVIPSGEMFPLSSIRDPQDVIDNFDNDLVRKDIQSLPSLDYTTQRDISKKYNDLHREVIARGFYQCRYVEYVKEMCRIGSLFLWFAIFYKTNHLYLSAFSLGCCWQQFVFIVHDAGHIGITHNYQLDNIIGILIAGFVGGLSVGWWKRNHNVHHLVTNDPIHDPDIQHLPFFAVSSRLLGNVYSTYYEKYLYFDKLANVLVRIQNYLYYPILCFGRFNLYRLAWTHVLLGQGPKKGKAAWFRYLELVGLVFFCYWFFYITVGGIATWRERFIFIMISHITTMLVHVQITLSHFGMSTSDLGQSESFPCKQLRTSMDVDCPEWLDYLHGGLQFQVIHHLFPRVPRHNFRRMQPLVIEFCESVGLRYSIYGFVKGNGKVIGKMADVARQVEILKRCLSSMESEFKDHKNEYEKRAEYVMVESI